MRPESDKYYCYQWCGRMRLAYVRDATGRDCKVLVSSSGRIVPGQAGSWDKYQHNSQYRNTDLLVRTRPINYPQKTYTYYDTGCPPVPMPMPMLVLQLMIAI
jgi:hypothetical protein